MLSLGIGVNMKRKLWKYLFKFIFTLLKYLIPYAILEKTISKHRSKKLQKLSIPSSLEPEIFNNRGNRLRTFFLLDEMYRDQPYSFVYGRQPQYIHWDRYNYGLQNHFYTHKYLLENIGKPIKKFGFLIESESIVPHHYNLLLNDRRIASNFNNIFTHSDKLLDTLPNALFLPGAGVWYGTKNSGGEITMNNFDLKKKNISIVSSNKSLCELHDFRISLSRHYLSSNYVDAFGTFNGGKAIKIAESLTYYRYSIVIENYISDYWFTEKILNCFASMTVPIYLGARKIDSFFNPEGIIKIDKIDFDYIDKLIIDCNESDYISRKKAIFDNFTRVQNYLCIEDYMYQNYKHLFFGDGN